MKETKEEKNLTSWFELRQSLHGSNNPIQDVIDYWNGFGFTDHVGVLDPYFQRGWPTPWEIIAKGKIDDFTKATMIGYTFKYTEPRMFDVIEVRTYVDDTQKRLYNVTVLDNTHVLNLNDTGACNVQDIPSHFRLDNVVALTTNSSGRE